MYLARISQVLEHAAEHLELALPQPFLQLAAEPTPRRPRTASLATPHLLLEAIQVTSLAAIPLAAPSLAAPSLAAPSLAVVIHRGGRTRGGGPHPNPRPTPNP